MSIYNSEKQNLKLDLIQNFKKKLLKKVLFPTSNSTLHLIDFPTSKEEIRDFPTTKEKMNALLFSLESFE